MAGMSFCRALDEVWPEYLQTFESTLGFSK